MRKQPKAPKVKKSQILIFNWLDFTEASRDADRGETVIFLFFAVFSLGSIGLIPLNIFKTYNIGHKCVIHIHVPSEAILKNKN